MTKVALKSKKFTPFGGIFSIMEQFDTNLSSNIITFLHKQNVNIVMQYDEICMKLVVYV